MKTIDMTADESAYDKYLNGEYTYDDYLAVCETQECIPEPQE